MNQAIGAWFKQNEEALVRFSRDIWEHPEGLMEEFYSCERTSALLKAQGFDIALCHCKDPEQRPNTIVARWGSGHPVVAVFGEYDALPGLAQDAVPHRAPAPGYGHGCGHNLMITASVGAACAVKAAMEQEKLAGTVVFFACPAEEGGNGKMYMHRLGLFDGIDCLLGWHPEPGALTANEKVNLSIAKLTFSFTGRASHASAAPEMGRSAMDAAELMSVGVQYMREHMSSDARIHHAYEQVVTKANVVPEHAVVDYMVRAKDLNSVQSLVERVVKVAQGAALMTETSVTHTLHSALPGTLILTSFTRFLYESACKIPPLHYDEAEKIFAQTLYRNVFSTEPSEDVLEERLVAPSGVPSTNFGSNDLGLVTHLIPTVRYIGLGLISGVPVHHWALTATAGMSIGQKAAVYVSKALAQSMYDILKTPQVIEAWQVELEHNRKGKIYTPVWNG